MLVCTFEPHQSEKGLKSNFSAPWVSILTTKPLYTQGPFSPDSFFLKKKKSNQAKKKNKTQPTNPHSIYQRKNSCKYLLSKYLEIYTLTWLKGPPCILRYTAWIHNKTLYCTIYRYSGFLWTSRRGQFPFPVCVPPAQSHKPKYFLQKPLVKCIQKIRYLVFYINNIKSGQLKINK